MIRGSHLSLLLGLLTALTAQAGGTPEAEVGAAPVLDDRYPHPAVAFPDDVESFPDLVYSVVPGYRPLRLDVYRPGSSTVARHPLVVYVHGGGWVGGHTRHSGAFANWPAVLASLAAKGYVVASIEYRLSDEAPFPAAVQDVKTSIRWLRSKARDFGIDPSRALLWGGSAGGQLAALAATTCGEDALAPAISPADEPLRAASDCVQGLVAWYGMFDLGGADRDPVVKYLGCVPSSCADRAALASPVTHLDARDPPTLLVHGEEDETVPVGQSRAFFAALQSKRIHAELFVIPEVDHSFIGASPASTRQASLAALSRTFAFIDATLAGQ
jgi:acetyl esterase/lipase